jgi:hypothetical protein
MGAIINDIHQAVEVLPGHRMKNTRSQSLHLDDLMDGLDHRLSAGARDLIFMAYRYLEAEKIFAKSFFERDPKSESLKDYCLIAYSAILSRDQIPLEVMAHEIVEAGKKELPKAFHGVLNAYCRRVGREKHEILKRLQSQPELLLSRELRERWSRDAQLMNRVGRSLLHRPDGGIWAFDAELNYKKWEASDFFKSKIPLQAMNPGSQRLLQAYFADCPLPKKPLIKILDLCTAPGAKLIWSVFQARNAGAQVQAVALEQKFNRMERLKENLRRFSLLESAKTQLTSVGDEDFTPEVLAETWDLVLVDLPCSGSGTLASRPDLLNENLKSRIDSLADIQARILRSLSTLRAKSTLVSVCSVDPAECQRISSLIQEPRYRPWTDDSDLQSDGLTGWVL